LSCVASDLELVCLRCGRLATNDRELTEGCLTHWEQGSRRQATRLDSGLDVATDRGLWAGDEGRKGIMFHRRLRHSITRTRMQRRLPSLASLRHNVGRVCLVAMVAIFSWAVILAPQAAHAAGGPNTALINGDTVTGGSSSVEAAQAIADGFTVTVVNGTTWDAMTAADFASYQVLIAGDPTCSFLAASFTSNADTWAPVVMGTSITTKPGNRILIGTDPVFHRTSHPGADHLIKDGIAFAGALPGRTGLYFDASCLDGTRGATTVATLAKLSTGAGTWTENASPPCGGSVSLVASNPAFSDVTSSDLQGWGCSDHETWRTFQDDWNALAVATDTPTKPTCGSDPGGVPGNTVCGEAYILLSGVGTVVTAPNITLTPTAATNPLGGSHTVTATITTPTGAPLVGQKVDFTITGQNAGLSGTCSPATCVTDASGKVTFTYPDANATASEYAATIDFGDGSSSAGAVSGPTGGPFTVSGTHTYTDEGTYAVTVTITDVDTPGNAATAHSTADVADAALTAGTVTVSGGVEGSSPTHPTSTFTDANPFATAADFTATIDWGDGASSTGAVTGAVGGPFTVTGSHPYIEEGSYTVTVTVADDGGSTTSASGPANVADAPLSATCAATRVSPMSFSGLVANLTDANVTATVADFTATIDWGDASSSAGIISGPTGGPYTVGGSHTYGATGQFVVTGTITDDGGSTAPISCPIFVFATTTGGTFVVGDQNSAIGAGVTFSGAKWAKLNNLSGGPAPAAFKGFEDTPSEGVTCGTSWSTDTGNSSDPPAGPLPTYIAVIVSSSVSQSGSTISGDTLHMVVVKTDPGYMPDPGHPGTATAVAQIC